MTSDPRAEYPSIGDARSRGLAARLRRSAREVTEPQRSTILGMLPHTLFISHSSADDAFIKGLKGEGGVVGRPGSIWWICGEAFSDPFYHSLKTGAAKHYDRIVGLALPASTRVLVVWSRNALRSDYVRAELLVALKSNKKLAAYLVPQAPNFPFAGVEVIHDCEALRRLLQSWR